MKNILFFVLFAAITGCSSNDTAVVKKTEQKNSAKYIFVKPEQATVSMPVKLPAQLTAYQEVSIFPKVNGYVRSISVDVGSRVSKGQPLMSLEAPELQQATVAAREKYGHARADFALDKEKYQRLLEASTTAGAVSPLDLSTLKSKMESDSALCNAEKSNWLMQQTMQTYLDVVAPFGGVITQRNVHPGALVSAASKDRPLLELKQVDHLRLQVDIPEAIAVTIRPHDTISFYTSAYPGRKMIADISRQSMNVSAQYRLERMEADVPNRDGMLSPGMYADVVLYSKGNEHAIVLPSSAVVTSTERKYVVVVRDGKAQKIDVATGNSSNGKIEVYGDVRTDDRVVANPDDDIHEGEVL